MSKDLFLESLKSQATGNHQRWSMMGIPEKKKKINEFGYALDVDMETPHDEIMNFPHEEDEDQNQDYDMMTQGTNQGDTENERLVGNLGRRAMYFDKTPEFMNAEPSMTPAKMQMASKGITQDEPPLLAIRRRMMDAEPKAKEAMAPEKIRMEVEEIYSEMAGLMSRLKALMQQL